MRTATGSSQAMLMHTCALMPTSYSSSHTICCAEDSSEVEEEGGALSRALRKAIESGDTDLVYLVLFHIYRARPLQVRVVEESEGLQLAPATPATSATAATRTTVGGHGGADRVLCREGVLGARQPHGAQAATTRVSKTVTLSGRRCCQFDWAADGAGGVEGSR